MTDRVQKIREEVVEIINSINLFTPDEDGKNSSYEAGKFDVASKILQVIDLLQKEPVSEDLEEVSNTLYPYEEMYDVELPYPSTWDANEEKRDAFKAGAQWQKQSIIDKACAWLEENYDSCDYRPNDFGEYYGKDKFIEHFRKAMEDNKLKKKQSYERMHYNRTK